MMASGKDVSELFAAVVKNVVSKNIEVSLLLYVYQEKWGELEIAYRITDSEYLCF